MISQLSFLVGNLWCNSYRESDKFLREIHDCCDEYPSAELQSLSKQIAAEESQMSTSCSLISLSANSSRTTSRDQDLEEGCSNSLDDDLSMSCQLYLLKSNSK